MVSSSGKAVNFIFTSAPASVSNVTWYIATSYEDGEDYVVWANIACPNLCQGDDYPSANATEDTKGQCDEQSGVCTCDDGYDELTCTKSGLAVVWIVLIVIAALIILAVAIGVPVGCYLRSRRKARYERV